MEIAKLTDIGTKRLENQDRVDIFQKNNYTMLLLCDGMGGHYGGSLAATTTINVFKDRFFSLENNQLNDINVFAEWFKDTISKTKEEMRAIASNDEAKLDMGTTATGAFIDTKNQRIFAFNIGDSRTYILNKKGELVQISTDHNVLTRLIKEEGWSKMEALKYPKCYALTSALGPVKKTKIDVMDITPHFEKISAIIATSDGIHGVLNELAMENIIRNVNDLNSICETLIKEAIYSKSTDNLSVGIVLLSSTQNKKRKK